MATTYATPLPARPALQSRGGRATAERSATRLTRRGRLAILTLIALMVVLPGSWRAVADAQMAGPASITVTVAPGDTLWGIATEARPGADPRELIAEIREVNGLVESGLTPGQELVVPLS
jgi:hypothetical protein